MEKILILEVERNGYSIDQLGSTMTVGELINYLEGYEEETKLYVSHDRGYTFGEVKRWNIREEEEYY